MFLNRIYLLAAFLVFLSVPSIGAGAENWTVPPEFLKKTNPISATEKSVMKGRGTFSQLCVRCHGVDGKGNRWMLEWWLGGKPDLSVSAKAKPDGELFYAIYNGKGLMTGYSKTLMDEDIYNLINFLRVIETYKAEKSQSLMF